MSQNYSPSEVLLMLKLQKDYRTLSPSQVYDLYNNHIRKPEYPTAKGEIEAIRAKFLHTKTPAYGVQFEYSRNRVNEIISYLDANYAEYEQIRKTLQHDAHGRPGKDRKIYAIKEIRKMFPYDTFKTCKEVAESYWY